MRLSVQIKDNTPIKAGDIIQHKVHGIGVVVKTSCSHLAPVWLGKKELSEAPYLGSDKVLIDCIVVPSGSKLTLEQE